MPILRWRAMSEKRKLAPRYELVRVDDGSWVGFYIAGELVTEGHNLNERDMLNALNLPHAVREIPESVLRKFNHSLPQNLKELPYDEG